MANLGKIIGITTLVGLVFGGAYKGYSFYNKVKQATGNVNFSISFLRVHGLVGKKGFEQFLHPVIRILFNLNVKNFSGFDIDVKNIRVRVEAQTAGNDTWNMIGATTVYLNLSVKDGKEKNQELYFDFKGIATITSLINKKNRHRIVMTYEYKGQSLDYTSDVDIVTPINTYWQKIKSGVNSLKGVGSFGNLQTAL